MRAICVVREDQLEVQDIQTPSGAADGHLLVKMHASAINPGDKYFLANPNARALVTGGMSTQLVWGASGAGEVIQIGTNVPAVYFGKKVAIYRSLVRTPEAVGLWSEIAHVPYLNCVILPSKADTEDYSGSLVNVMTAYAFLEEVIEEGHRGMIATAGNSATGRALFALAEKKNVLVISLVRSDSQKRELERLGQTNILVTTELGFEEQLKSMAEKLHTTAIFEGVGGELVSRIAPLLPMKSTIYFYGFLTGAASFSLQSRLMMEKNMLMRPFSNFMSKTVTDRKRLFQALTTLSELIENPAFRTKVGSRFKYEQIDEAIQFAGEHGEKCLLVP